MKTGRAAERRRHHSQLAESGGNINNAQKMVERKQEPVL